MSTLSRSTTCLAVLVAATVLVSCDGTPAEPDPVTFGGVALDAVGGATLQVSGSTLVVSGLPAGADGGFAVPGLRQRVDVTIDPVTLPSGGRFGARVEEADGTEISSIYAEGLDGDTVRLTFSFSAGVDAVRILYKRGAETLFTIPRLSVEGVPFAATVRLPQSAGEGAGKSGSVHAVRRDGRWVVVSDSEGSRQRPGGAAGGCPGYFILPPAVGGVIPPDAPLCVDWVEVQPLSGQAATAARTVVFARGLDQFTVQTLGVE